MNLIEHVTKVTIVTRRSIIYYIMKQVKFIAKVSALGEKRYTIVFPKEQAEEGERLKGKHVRVILEEITV